MQRGIIRHLILILDMSQAMNEKDLRPTRFLLTLVYTTAFIHEFFEQNPISQLGIIGMHNGIAIRISDMSGNPTAHIAAIQKIRKTEPKGNPSLENALEMARAALFHTPSHGTREILLVFGALHTSDPGDIHRTIANLVADKIRATVIGLAAQVAICAELVRETNNADRSNYHVVLHEQHFRDLMLAVTTPPITQHRTQTANALLMMGFPSRTVEPAPSLCACHTRPSRAGYLCSRCGTKVCSLPSECPTCGLTLILSTHLARSYHHLFPLVNWTEVPWARAHRSKACFACLRAFPDVPRRNQWERVTPDGKRVPTGSSRYECTFCRRHFCVDCDLFAHEVVHNCPGCQAGNLETSLMGEVEIPLEEGEGRRNGHAVVTTAEDGMDLET